MSLPLPVPRHPELAEQYDAARELAHRALDLGDRETGERLLAKARGMMNALNDGVGTLEDARGAVRMLEEWATSTGAIRPTRTPGIGGTKR